MVYLHRVLPLDMVSKITKTTIPKRVGNDSINFGGWL